MLTISLVLLRASNLGKQLEQLKKHKFMVWFLATVKAKTLMVHTENKWMITALIRLVCLTWRKSWYLTLNVRYTIRLWNKPGPINGKYLTSLWGIKPIEHMFYRLFFVKRPTIIFLWKDQPKHRQLHGKTLFTQPSLASHFYFPHYFGDPQ